jgi:hypothetical protein
MRGGCDYRRDLVRNRLGRIRGSLRRRRRILGLLDSLFGRERLHV